MQARVLDFHVPLYRLRPSLDQLSMCLDRSLAIVTGLASKYAAARVGDSLQREAPHSVHLEK